MWHNIGFEDIPDAFFQYKYDTDYFYVKCELYAPNLSGSRVYVCSGSNKLSLGTLSESGALLTLDKSYPLTFLRSHEIDAANLSHFSIELPQGSPVNSYPLSSPDPALLRAQKILDSMPHTEYAGIGEENICRIHRTLSSLNQQSLPFESDFTWYIVDDIKQTFSLSSIRHIVFTPAFMQSFAVYGHWFFGVCDIREIFAVCIKSDDSLPNPMSNALDCDITFPSDLPSEHYHIVGIALYDEGQYFCKINS